MQFQKGFFNASTIGKFDSSLNVYDDNFYWRLFLTLRNERNTGKHSIFGLPAVWLQYSGHEKTVMTVLVLSIVLNGVLNAVLIPIFEIEGAAISTCISLIVSSIILTIKMYTCLKILPWSGVEIKERVVTS
ncbi:polysaccharide biosynthesis C-terminal domain-containing protein [Shewanella sp. 202IG2-18]|uniref:polysaccharide biosynthesis C-terminal domain-containing protein n=1 Tax=Parashewanella hymeniacidonis TaxID=2807618 RepID=UPI001961E262|nr:polysaccharide biosynthesis C-terminal domain-containing protein [Parashewanella hymeniacidonis]MBM7071641.1 polysaccharide biosynthesis C-terminal domain-containing protein [Parashewanella hymeniacidonis]